MVSCCRTKCHHTGCSVIHLSHSKTAASLQSVKVLQLLCACGQVLPYDGLEDAILNLNNVDLFTHEVLKGHSVSVS
ncbi:hypothetical protein ABBQ32_012912 [Trebouxia sp. C0010 RCD-2024]